MQKTHKVVRFLPTPNPKIKKQTKTKGFIRNVYKDSTEDPSRPSCKLPPGFIQAGYLRGLELPLLEAEQLSRQTVGAS